MEIHREKIWLKTNSIVAKLQSRFFSVIYQIAFPKFNLMKICVNVKKEGRAQELTMPLCKHIAAIRSSLFIIHLFNASLSVCVWEAENKRKKNLKVYDL